MARVAAGNVRIQLPSGRALSKSPAMAKDAFNALVQGAGRDELVDAGIRLADAGFADNLWLCIHDEWVLEIPDTDVEATVERITSIMATTFNGCPSTPTRKCSERTGTNDPRASLLTNHQQHKEKHHERRNRNLRLQRSALRR